MSKRTSELPTPLHEKPGLFGWNRRQRTLWTIGLTAGALIIIYVAGMLLGDSRITTNFQIKNQPPSWKYLFGTDWHGRDMFVRTIKGLNLSIGIGLIASSVSVVMAFLLGVASATMGRWMDRLVTWLIDLFMGIPHLVFIILISIILGGGAKGVIVGVAITHWASLARVVRAEVMRIRTDHYIEIARKFGKNSSWIAFKHIMPQLLAHIVVGGILLFPHAILHEAAVTFLGFGLSPHEPAIGIILSESMNYLAAGYWWLAFFPGLCLLLLVRAFDIVGTNLRLLIDPHNAHD